MGGGGNFIGIFFAWGPLRSLIFELKILKIVEKKIDNVFVGKQKGAMFKRTTLSPYKTDSGNKTNKL